MTDVWFQKTDFGGGGRTSAVGFSIGNKGYVGTGINGITHLKDFWEYDPSTNLWTQKTDFGGAGRYDAAGFSVGDKGYIGTGRISSGSYVKDFWEYDPSTNLWTPNADFGGAGRWDAVGFSIGENGYTGTGESSATYTKDFWGWCCGVIPVTTTACHRFTGGIRHRALQ